MNSVFVSDLARSQLTGRVEEEAAAAEVLPIRSVDNAASNVTARADAKPHAALSNR